MATGQPVFYSGVGSLALTVIINAVFLLKKPKHNTERAAYENVVGNVTQRFRNGYLTERMAVRREQSAFRVGTEPVSQEIIPLESNEGIERSSEEHSDGPVLLTFEAENLAQRQGGGTVCL